MKKFNSNPKNHFLLIKSDGFDPRGRKLSARESASLLLGAGIWPLWSHSRNRNAIRAGANLAVYLSGDRNQCVIATAVVKEVSSWTKTDERSYPLTLDGIPQTVLRLDHVRMLDPVAKVSSRLPDLSFVTKDSATGKPIQKWGVCFMGGTRAMSAEDFEVITRKIYSLADFEVGRQYRVRTRDFYDPLDPSADASPGKDLSIQILAPADRTNSSVIDGDRVIHASDLEIQSWSQFLRVQTATGKTRLLHPDTILTATAL